MGAEGGGVFLRSVLWVGFVGKRMSLGFEVIVRMGSGCGDVCLVFEFLNIWFFE